jgi:7-cyano-7-deazaguanine synthase in queuosine biosynthesis
MKLVKGSTVLIPWSGGMDSTYLVYKAIMSGCIVTTAYYKIENNDLKVEAELKARGEMMDYFRNLAREHGTRYNDLGVTFSVNIDYNRPVGQFTQTPLWVLASAYCAGPFDYVAMGFVQGDETISWQKEYNHLFDAYKRIQHDFVKPPKVKLIYPISRTKKDAIYYHLPDEIKRKTWTCEYPTKIGESLYECGHCKTCNTHKDNAGSVNYPVPDIREYDECIKQEDDLDTMLELRSSVNRKIRDLRKKSLVVLTVDERCDEVDCEEVEHDKVS